MQVYSSSSNHEISCKVLLEYIDDAWKKNNLGQENLISREVANTILQDVLMSIGRSREIRYQEFEVVLDSLNCDERVLKD